MKRTVSLILSLVLVLSLFLGDFAIHADAASGKTLTIRTAEDLTQFANQVANNNSYADWEILLEADLDMKDVGWLGIGYNLNHYFAGTFNGQNHTIRNLAASGSVDSFSILNAPRHTVGLFGVCSGATIKNLVIENADFSITNESGYQNSYSSISGTNVYGGVVCGYAINSTFQNIIVRSSSVSVHTGAESAEANCGGLCGYATLCSFAHCRNEDGTVRGTTVSLNNDAYAGGLIGMWHNGGTMRQCCNTSLVLGSSANSAAYTGGLVGKSVTTGSVLSTIRDCYNRGQVQHSSQMMELAYAGGLLGYSASSVNRCYNAGYVVVTSGGYVVEPHVGGIAAGCTSSASVTNSAVVSSSLSGGGVSTIAPSGTKTNNLVNKSLPSDSSAKGYSLSSFYGSALYADELGWDFTSIWTANADSFPELQYKDADSEQDILLVEEAAQAVTVQLGEGDRYSSVRKNVTLTGSPNGASVVWVSGNEEVISASNGVVTRQPEDYLVRLTATISSGNYSVQKIFSLNVVGTSDTPAEEPADWAMSQDDAIAFVSTMRHDIYRNISADDPYVRVLMGKETDETILQDFMTDLMLFLEVPGENEWLRSKMGDVIGLLREGKHDASTEIVSDAIGDSMIWADPEVNWRHNLGNLAFAICDVSADYINDAAKLADGPAEYSFDSDRFDDTMDALGRITKFTDYVADFTVYHAEDYSFYYKDAEGEGSPLSGMISWMQFSCNALSGFAALTVEKNNAAKSYISKYVRNREQFASAEDETFRLIMSANAVGSILTSEQYQKLDTTAEMIYRILKNFGRTPEAYQVIIRCPVDVSVYDRTGKLVGRVVDNQVDRSLTNSLRIEVGGAQNDEKTIYVEDPDAYTFTLTGNDSGDMRIDVVYTDAQGVRTSSFDSIPLTDGKTMSLELSGETACSGELPPVYRIEDGLRKDVEKESVDGDRQHKLTVYPFLEQSDGLLLTSDGGYCREGYFAEGTELRSLVTVQDGYVFDGFYTDSDCTQAYSGTTLQSALTLYAKFRVNNSGITITTQPKGAAYIEGDAADPLIVEAASDGTITYQWYRYETQKQDAQAIDGAVSAQYLPEVQTVGSVWYFVRVSVKSGGELISLDSEPARITVSERTYLAEGTCESGQNWRVGLDGALVVSGTGTLEAETSGASPWNDSASKITSITVSEGIDAVGANVFSGLSAAKTATLPNSLNSIGAGVFSGCTALERLSVPFVGASRGEQGTKSAVLGHLFGTSGSGVLQHYVLSGTTLSGARYAIPASLQEIHITDAEQLPFGAFYNCSNLTEITLNDGLTVVSGYAFANCTGLQSLLIPDSVTEIADQSLSGCTGLTELTIPFVGTNRTANQNESAVLGHLFDTASEGTAQYVSKSGTSISVSTFAIPSGLKTVTVTDAEQIPFGAFSGCSGLTEIRLNDGISHIGGYAFHQCDGLTALIIPDSMEEIEEYALKGCNHLQSLSVPFAGSSRSASETYDAAFGYPFGRSASASENYYVQYSIRNGTSISGYGYAVPDSLTEIRITDAETIPFGACSGLTQVQTLYLGHSLTEVSDNAFDGCTGLTDVYFDGTEAQWSKVAIGSENEPLTGAVFHFVEPKTVKILQQPVDFSGNAGDTATFTVSAEGDTLQYLWYSSSDGGVTWEQAQFSGQETATLQPVLQDETAGMQFKCVITDADGNTAETVTVSMNLEFIPLAIVTQPKNYVGKVNTTASFAVEAAGTGLTYQWQISDNNGAKWTNSSVKSAAYTSTLTSARDGRMLRCIITDREGNKVTSEAVSMRIYRLMITAQPADYFGAVNSTAHFSVSVQGEQLSYQWQISDNNGAKWTNSSAKTAEYNSKLSAVRDGRLVRCIITDADGNTVTSDSAAMRIFRFAILSQPKDYNGKVNSMATFRVEAMGEGLTYQWQFSDNNGAKWTKSSVTSEIYTTKLSAVRNGRLVRCIIKDANGETLVSEIAAMRIVSFAITGQPENYVGKVNSTATFTVTATGEGLTYQWQISDNDGKKWSKSSVTEPVYTTKLSAARNGRLVRCIVTDADGNTLTSDAARMTIG